MGKKYERNVLRLEFREYKVEEKNGESFSSFFHTAVHDRFQRSSISYLYITFSSLYCIRTFSFFLTCQKRLLAFVSRLLFYIHSRECSSWRRDLAKLRMYRFDAIWFISIKIQTSQKKGRPSSTRK